MNMAKSPEKPLLSVVSSRAATISPPRPLGSHGTALWDRIQAEFGIHDCGGAELLAQACQALESVRKHQAGLQSFRSMRRIEASRRNASALRLRFSQSFASLRQRLSQAKVRSTTQRRGSTTNPFIRSERLTISVSS